MDTVTHGLFGYTLYQAYKKPDQSKRWNYALLTTSLVANQAPDVDVFVSLTETGEIMKQMWHRGLTHSVFLIPVWAILIYGLIRLTFRETDSKFFWIAFWGVFIHDTSDLFNAWGTGYLEPFSSIRITFGFIPIIDFVIWIIFIIGALLAHGKKVTSPQIIFRWVGILIIAHISIQSVQGMIVKARASADYEQTELSASFVPGVFQVIGKDQNKVEISQATAFTERKKIAVVESQEEADLSYLFAKNPKAKVLHTWSPFVVIFENDQEIGIYDPRFLDDGKSFLTETAPKK